MLHNKNEGYAGFAGYVGLAGLARRTGLTGLAGLTLFCSSAHAATINAASCQQAAVSTAIGQAQVGDIVSVPAGNCSWSGLSLNKAVHLRGAGTGLTLITLTGANTVTKSAAGIIRISNLRLTSAVAGVESAAFYIDGSWRNAQPIVWQNNAFVTNGSSMFRIGVAGGVIFSHNSFTGQWDDSFLKIKDAQDSDGSWTSADSMGSRDTQGTLNLYIEDNTFVGGTNQGIDCDDACRMVNRHNTFTNSESNSHGKDTSPTGMRHFEIYNNFFYNTGAQSNDTAQIANENQAVWIRGGTGVIFNNYFDNLAGNWWGDKSEIRMNLRSDAWSCSSPPAYPVSHQIGQNNNGSSDFTDPIYLWGNTAGQGISVPVMSADYGWGNGCGRAFSFYFQSGRDYVNSGSANSPKPGYAIYTYPHPLVSGTPPPPPPPPAGSACDLNSDNNTNVSDVQLCANQAIGSTACSTGDINNDNQCNVIDVQRVVNAALGGQCVTQ